MASVVDVCNRGLDKLGHGPITSLTDGNKAANLCNRSWPIVRDQVLRDHPWNFAMKRAVLAPASTAPEWGFLYKHPLPADFLRLIEIRDLGVEDYQVEGKTILADDDALYIRYTARIENPNEYDALFIDAVAARLAYELAEPLTQSNTKRDAAWQEYTDGLKRAKMTDAQENPPAQFEEDDWITVRY